MIHSLTGKRETFCQLVAADETYTDAYLEAFQKPSGYDRKLAAEAGSRLIANTEIVLRVQELRRPVIRKFRVGAELLCWIIPQNEVHPFSVEGATVRWSHAQEFGLAFTNVHPGAQRQIAQLCAQATLAMSLRLSVLAAPTTKSPATRLPTSIMP